MNIKLKTNKPRYRSKKFHYQLEATKSWITLSVLHPKPFIQLGRDYKKSVIK